MLFDTHCHLTDERLRPDIDDVVSGALKGGVARLVTVGCDRESSLESAEIAARYPEVYCTVGIHPHDAVTATREIYEEFRALAADNAKVLAIGEIGLDYHYDLSPRDVQRRVFGEQLRLARECELPVCLHVREAYEDCRALLEENRDCLGGGVLLHCYSGSAEMVKVFSEYDAYFAFGGAITFKGARRNLEALAAVPLDRLLLETDAPYMTPVPYRGQTNRPEYVAIVADKAAEVLGTSREEIEKITTENAKRFFKRMK